MKKYINRQLMFIVGISFILSLIGYYAILFYINQSLTFNIQTPYPIGNWNIFIFFSKHLILLLSFVTIFTILGSYLISKNWVKEVSIRTETHKNNGYSEKKPKITFFSEEEKKLLNIMVNTEGEIYQNDLTTKSGLPRYQVSRIISRFSNYGIIEKERFGMTNVIRLKLDHVEV